MTLLTLAPAGLQALATHCEGASAEVAVSSTPAVPSARAQATAVAVSVLHTGTVLTGTTLSGRLTTHATQLNTVADGFAAEDTHDAASLAALAAAR